jgi:hypothetical protein
MNDETPHERVREPMPRNTDVYLAHSPQREREWVAFVARCEAIAAGAGGTPTRHPTITRDRARCPVSVVSSVLVPSAYGTKTQVPAGQPFGWQQSVSLLHGEPMVPQQVGLPSREPVGTAQERFVSLPQHSRAVVQGSPNAFGTHVGHVGHAGHFFLCFRFFLAWLAGERTSVLATATLALPTSVRSAMRRERLPTSCVSRSNRDASMGPPRASLSGPHAHARIGPILPRATARRRVRRPAR